MKTKLTRRDCLEALAGSALLCAWPASAQTHSAPELFELDDDLGVVAHSGANVTVLAGSNELLLVDTGLAHDVAAQNALLAAAWPGRPVRTAFNTSWRPAHTGGNGALQGAGARLLAHENTRLWMAARFDVDWQGLHHEPRAPGELPSHGFYEGGETTLDDERVVYGHLPRAHTDGDIYVHLPARNVLAVGGLLATTGYPVPDYATGGWIGGLRDATRSLLSLSNDTTRIVAGDGVVQGRAALEAQLELCEHVLREVASSYRSGGSLQDFLDRQPAGPFTAHRGDPTLFLELVYEGAFPYVRELGGII